MSYIIIRETHPTLFWENLPFLSEICNRFPMNSLWAFCGQSKTFWKLSAEYSQERCRNILTYDVTKSGRLGRSHRTMEISNANVLYLTHFSLLCPEYQWKQMIARYWFKHAKWTCKYFFFVQCVPTRKWTIWIFYIQVFIPVFLCRVPPSPCRDDNVKL